MVTFPTTQPLASITLYCLGQKHMCVNNLPILLHDSRTARNGIREFYKCVNPMPACPKQPNHITHNEYSALQ